MKVIDDITMGARKLSINKKYFSSAKDNRGFDAILLIVGLMVAIVLFWVAGGARSQHQSSSGGSADQSPVANPVAGQ
ncbi:MAG: hypothetical protein ABJB40_09365 [Acidobacteriota bacterium]